MNTKYFLSGLLMVSICLSCSDILDKKDLSAVTDAQVWNDPLYATAYLNKLCRDNLPGWDADVASNSDEAEGESDLIYGELTINSIDTWPYDQIRKINLLFENIEGGSIDEETKTLLKGQASVLRAWRYFQMVRLYGGVPMILMPQKLTDDLYVSRNKTSECIDLIVKDLDDAIAALPWSWSGNDEGRITKAAALALKGRVLLYYASPQFNPDGNKDRWETAYTVNKYVKEELEKNGYGLYDDYANIWFDEMNKEAVFVQRYQEPGRTNSWDAATRPISEAQNYTAKNHPTWEMVESYPMNTGIKTSESQDYDPVLFWKNRDPRFTSTIAYNGCIWELSGKKGRRQWTFNETSLKSNTGFYCRKAVNVSYTPYYTERSSTDWIEIRFAEVLMNYAECAAELGKTDEAYEMLKLIRARAGIIPGEDNMYGLKPNMSSGEMLESVMQERKIEFAFEGKRYWDLRRRKLFDAELNGKRRHGISSKLLVSLEEFDRAKDLVDFENEYATYFKDEVVVVDTRNEINLRDNYYFFAIPNKHLEANSKLQQTQGWPGGTFNPYD